MTDPADQGAYRHPVVYRTVRGLTLSGGRATGGVPGGSVLAPPRRERNPLNVQRGPDLDADSPATARDGERAQDDSTSLYELRRYREPND